MSHMIIFSLSMLGYAMILFADTTADEALQSRYEHELRENTPPEASPELLRRINTINNRINSREWKERQHRYGRDLAGALDIKEGDPTAPENQDSSADREGKLVLFISSSMPEHVINRYAGDLSLLNGVMVMRGGISGIKTIKPTLRFIYKVLRKDRQCQGADCEVYPVDILIDPALFTRKGITRVPALVFVSEDSLNTRCGQDHPGHTDKEADVIYGDATLNGMVEALYKMTADKRLESYLEKTRE